MWRKLRRSSEEWNTTKRRGIHTCVSVLAILSIVPMGLSAPSGVVL
jgi:hypothetical protein